MVSDASNRKFDHRLVHCKVGQKLEILCQKCATEYTDEIPLWVVKWPGHYFKQQRKRLSKICESRYPQFFPKDWRILRTLSTHTDQLDKEGFEVDYAIRSCLRSHEECTGLRKVVESWCMRCKENAVMSGGRKTTTDRHPRYTLGQKPFYVERRGRCALCQKANRTHVRLVPVQAEIDSIFLHRLQDLVKHISHLDREIKGHVMDQMLQLSAKTSRFDEGEAVSSAIPNPR